MISPQTQLSSTNISRQLLKRSDKHTVHCLLSSIQQEDRKLVSKVVSVHNLFPRMDVIFVNTANIDEMSNKQKTLQNKNAKLGLR